MVTIGGGCRGELHIGPRRAAVAVAVLAALVLAGCGSGPRPGLAAGRLAGHTVEVAAIWTGTEQANFRVVLDAFAAQTGASVSYTSGGDDLPALLNSRLAGGAPPDVALLGQPGVVADLARRGVLRELTGEAARAVAANYTPWWRELGMVDGTPYGVSFKVAHKSVVWYRPDRFAEAGVDPPATWDDLLSVSTTLADAGTVPMAVPGADGWTLTDWFENVYLRVAGPDRYDQLARRELPWTDPTVVETLRILGGYWADGRAVQGGAAGALQLKFVQAVADVFGEKPKSAMLYQGDFVASEINKLGRAAVGQDARFFDFPSINGSPPAVVAAGDHAVALRDTPAAMALLAYLASPEAAALMAAQGGFLSANRNLDPAAYPDPTMRQLARSLAEAELLRFDLSDLTPQAFGGGTSASMWRLLQEFLRDPGDPVATARQLEQAARRDFGNA